MKHERIYTLSITASCNLSAKLQRSEGQFAGVDEDPLRRMSHRERDGSIGTMQIATLSSKWGSLLRPPQGESVHGPGQGTEVAGDRGRSQPLFAA